MLLTITLSLISTTTILKVNNKTQMEIRKNESITFGRC